MAKSARQICAILEQHGFIAVRQKGSHISMQKKKVNTTITVIVPNHKEISVGTLASIIRQSGLPKSTFR